MDHGFDRGLFLFPPKNLKESFFLTSSGSPSADINKGAEKVSSKNTNLEINKGINLDTVKRSGFQLKVEQESPDFSQE